MAQSVKHEILDFSSDRDLTVHEIEPCVGLSANSVEPGRDSLSPSLSAPPLLILSLPLSLNKHFKKSLIFEMSIF